MCVCVLCVHLGPHKLWLIASVLSTLCTQTEVAQNPSCLGFIYHHVPFLISWYLFSLPRYHHGITVTTLGGCQGKARIMQDEVVLQQQVHMRTQMQPLLNGFTCITTH